MTGTLKKLLDKQLECFALRGLVVKETCIHFQFTSRLKILKTLCPLMLDMAANTWVKWVQMHTQLTSTAHILIAAFVLVFFIMSRRFRRLPWKSSQLGAFYIKSENCDQMALSPHKRQGCIIQRLRVLTVTAVCKLSIWGYVLWVEILLLDIKAGPSRHFLFWLADLSQMELNLGLWAL